MTREKAKELLPIIQAYAEGKDIQERGGSNFEWNVSVLCHLHTSMEYRIKPEPRRGWVPTYAICATPEAATILAKSMCGSPVGERCEVIPVIEVLK